MTQILGTITDSALTPLSGTLEIKLNNPKVLDSTTPNSLMTVKSHIFNITSGVVNIELSVSEEVSYHLKFTSDEVVYLEFDFLIPADVSPIELSTLFPTGIVNDTLTTGALRVAKILTSIESFRQKVAPVYTLEMELSGNTISKFQRTAKPFAGRIKIKRLNVLILSGGIDWDFESGIIYQDNGLDTPLDTPTFTSFTVGGRTFINYDYDEEISDSALGLYTKAIAGTGNITGTVTLTYQELP
ncbi:MAG: hypothetical protein KME13_18420 [Myxacorys californica WJT36-NPBG1]|jgi:hypothetical protein|nr:hypothetical protein [Myxacorys californica WJT36-NPBG1]